MKYQALVAPVIVFMAVAFLLVLARYYEDLPVKAPPCALNRLTGLPCPACRGTRSFIALSQGRVGDALRLNPLAAGLVAASILWLAGFAFRKGLPPKKTMSGKAVAWITGGLILFNWIYLILTRNSFP